MGASIGNRSLWGDKSRSKPGSIRTRDIQLGSNPLILNVTWRKVAFGSFRFAVLRGRGTFVHAHTIMSASTPPNGAAAPSTAGQTLHIVPFMTGRSGLRRRRLAWNGQHEDE